MTAILELPPLPPTSSNPLKLSSLSPYAIDPSWKLKKTIGNVLDRFLGLVWSMLISIGAGSVVAGLLEMVVIAVLSVWWLSHGGGQQGDLGWMLGSLNGRP